MWGFCAECEGWQVCVKYESEYLINLWKALKYSAASYVAFQTSHHDVLSAGGLAQRYSYYNTPNCGSKAAAVIVKRRFRRAAGNNLKYRNVFLSTSSSQWGDVVKASCG